MSIIACGERSGTSSMIADGVRGAGCAKVRFGPKVQVMGEIGVHLDDPSKVSK